MKKLLSAILVFAAVQAAFADCRGTVYVKAPENWTKAYFAVQNMMPQEMTRDPKSGYFYADLGKGQQYYDMSRFSIGNSDGVRPIEYITAADWVATENFDSAILQNKPQFNCPGDGNTVYIIENPAEPGKTVISSEPPNSKVLYFLPPEKMEWIVSAPVISDDGGMTWKSMKTDMEHCGWFTYTWFGEEPTELTVVAPGNNDGKVEPIALDVMGIIFDAYGVNTLYYVADKDMWVDDGSLGWYIEYPEVESICSYTLGALIYDTDASLHPSFSCSEYMVSEACQMGVQNAAANINMSATEAQSYVSACIGVHHGIVVDTLGPDKKPHLSNSANAQKCFPNERIFNMLFNYTQGVNEMSCYYLPLGRTSEGAWEFNSDMYVSAGVEPAIMGGFYPVEQTDDNTISLAYATQTPVAPARTKRMAMGPVFMAPALREVNPLSGENAPRMDLLCNGPGWSGGMDCEGLYADGDDLNEILSPIVGMDNVWCWGSYCIGQRPKDWPLFKEGTGTYTTAADSYASPRWGSETGTGMITRNQHFCFESHAEFVYQPGQRFAFRGDDDIWVFIDNKLAVDIGGTHLAAPGYVVLDNFKGKSGELIPGNRYDFDMFFCDRRTTMSNVRIYSNIFFEQQTKVDFKQTVNSEDGSTSIEACFIDFHDKDCVSQLGPHPKMDTVCTTEMEPELVQVSYSLVRTDGKVILSEEEMAEPKVYKGGIDLTNRANPVIAADKIVDLGPGTYNLVITINGKVQKIPITIDGGVDVASRNAYSVEPGSDEVVKYPFVSAVAAEEKAPLYISYIVDPCENADSTCDSPLQFRPDYAVGLEYKMSVPKGLTLHRRNSKGEIVEVKSSSTFLVGASGVDTVYVSAPSSTKAKTYKIGIVDRPMVAKVKFNAAKTEVAEDFDVDLSSSSSAKPSSSSSSAKGVNSSSSVANDNEYAAPSFRIKLTGPFTFSIVFNKTSTKTTKSYVVMDMMGVVVKTGKTNSAETSVSLRNAGSYVVRVGHDSRVVTIKAAEEDK